MSDSDSDDDVPLGQMKKSTTAAKKKAPAKKAKKEGEATTKKEVPLIGLAIHMACIG